MKKQILLSFSILLLAFTAISAQKTPKTISGGVVNGKAANLPKPVYPKEAAALGVGGSVSVSVLIDEEGKVVSAKAVSGHPLLHEVSETAARGAKFLPTKLEGHPVKVSGIITYVYNIKISFLRIGYELALAEKSPGKPEYFYHDLIIYNLPKDWEEEIKSVRNINLYYRLQTANELEEKQKAENPPIENKPVESSTEEDKEIGVDKVGRDTVLTRRIGVPILGNKDVATTAPLAEIKNLDPTITLQNLQSKIKSRLNSDEKLLWFFKFGMILGNIDAEIDDSEKMQANINDLEKLVEKIPADVIPAAVQRAEGIINFYRTAPMNEGNKQKLIEFIRMFQRSRVY